MGLRCITPWGAAERDTDPHATTHTFATIYTLAPTDRAATSWATKHILALFDMYALVAQHSGFVGAWRFTGVCRAALAGTKEWLGSLPGWVVSGGLNWTGLPASEVWRLDLRTLQWGSMPTLVAARGDHACCTVRGALVVLSGTIEDESPRDW